MLEDRLVEGLGRVRDDLREYLRDGEKTTGEFKARISESLQRIGLLDGMTEDQRDRMIYTVDWSMPDKIPTEFHKGIANSYFTLKDSPLSEKASDDVQSYRRIISEAKHYLDTRFEEGITTRTQYRRLIDEFLDSNEFTRSLKGTVGLADSIDYKMDHSPIDDPVVLGGFSKKEVKEAMDKL